MEGKRWTLQQDGSWYRVILLRVWCPELFIEFQSKASILNLPVVPFVVKDCGPGWQSYYRMYKQVVAYK